jgi:hypothetical protein
MGVKHSFFLPLYILFFLFLPPALYAGEESYYMERDGGEVHFFQRLAWKVDENALYYEVIVEQDESGAFQEIMRVAIEETVMEVSLNPGKFRYRVIAYDLLDRPGETPEWTYFDILPALEPVITEMSPLFFYLDEDDRWTLTIAGKNLEKNAEVSLRRLGSSSANIVPADYVPNAGASGASLIFNAGQLNPGTYEVYIKNPGGLDTSFGTLTITFKNSFSLYVGASYSPLFSLHGAVKNIFDTFVFPLGASAHTTFIPIKRAFGMFGLELTASWYHLYSRRSGYEVSMHMLGAELNFVYQRWLSNKRMAWVFRIGGGAGMGAEFDFIYDSGGSYTMSVLFPQIQAGTSFVWLVKRPLYLEAGIDLVEWITGNSSTGQIRSRVGAGWRF